MCSADANAVLDWGEGPDSDSQRPQQRLYHPWAQKSTLDFALTRCSIITLIFTIAAKFTARVNIAGENNQTAFELVSARPTFGFSIMR